MITFIILYGFLFFIVGYFIKLKFDRKQAKIEEDYYLKLKNFNLKLLHKSNVYDRKSNILLINNAEIQISSNVSSAIQEIFDYIILKYISNWYNGFSNDDDFIIEIKYFFHVIFAELFLRIKQIDLVKFIHNKALPIIVNHLEICSNIQKSYTDSQTSTPTKSGGIPAVSAIFQDRTLSKLTKHLHVALLNRSAEVEYLRSLSRIIVHNIAPHYLVSHDNKSCVHFLRETLISVVLLPTMDSIANPDVINKLICLVLQPLTTSLNGAPSLHTSVPILHRYQQSWLEKWKVAKNHPKPIEVFLRNEKYFYNFLQFIKSIDAVSPIIFFKEIDSITMRLLDPDMNIRQKENLLEDLVQLDRFISSPSTNGIGNVTEIFPGDIDSVTQFQEALRHNISLGAATVDQLINCQIWMENYNKIRQHIIHLYLPLYFESEFFLVTLYKTKQFTDLREKRKESSLNKFGNSIRNVLSISPEFEHSSLGVAHEDFEEDSLHLSEDFYLEDSTDGSRAGRKRSGANQGIKSINNHHSELSSQVLELPDLSTLRVKITGISQRNILDRSPSIATEMTYTLHTYKADSELLVATVYRKYNDFYVLEQKLNEFHGSLGRSLPGRKLFEMRKLDFLDRCKAEFEDYLNFMISRTSLRNSELLYNFLTVDSLEYSLNGNDLYLARLVKSVPMKLTTKKGQFLDQFLDNYHASCEAKPSPSSMTSHTQDIAADAAGGGKIKSMLNTRMHATQFWNNAGILSLSWSTITLEVCEFTSRHVFSFYSVFFVLLDTVTRKLADKVSDCVFRVMLGIRPLLAPILDDYVTSQLARGITKALLDFNLVESIHNLKEAVLFTTGSRSTSDKNERKKQAETCIKKLIPDSLRNSMLPASWGSEIDAELELLFSVLQQPKLNKQLTYHLLDCLMVEMFPEMSESG